ncbi:hypothetical protein J4E08_10310 [Sagittula sp. NFXS13]|uniref:hypothetical protein n=1 Tax=Sagittula sp. NFXS13 TaxID=2819095 RepID=UPI0032E051E7
MAEAPSFEATLSTGRGALSRVHEAIAVVLLSWFLWRLFQDLQQPDLSWFWIGFNLLVVMMIAGLLIAHVRGLIRPSVTEVLRIDADGLHLPDRPGKGQGARIPWGAVTSVELNRVGSHLVRSYVTHGHGSAQRVDVLPFARLDHVRAQDALGVIKHYWPDAKLPAQEQMARTAGR